MQKNGSSLFNSAHGERLALQLHQLEINAALLDQLAVRAGLCNPAVVNHHKPVCPPQGGEAVGDRDGRASLDQPVEGILNGHLGFGVDRGRGLVQDQNPRVGQNGPCDRDSLPLTARKRAAGRSDHRIVAVGHFADEIMRAGGNGGGHHLVVGRPLFGIGDVFLHRAHENIRLLRDHGDARAKVGKGHLPDVDPVNEDVPLLRVVQPVDQIHQSGFSRARPPDNAQHLARTDMEVDILQHVAVRLIPEGDVPQLNLSAHVGKADGLLRLGNLRNGVDNLKNALGSVGAVGPPAKNVRHEIQRPVQLRDIGGKGNQHAKLDAPISQNQHGAKAPHGEVGQILHNPVEGVEPVVIGDDVQLGRPHPPVVYRKALFLIFLLPEGLDHTGAGDVVVDLAVQTPADAVPLAIEVPQPRQHFDADNRRNGQQNQRNDCQLPIHHQHDHDGRNDGKGVGEEVGEAVDEKSGHLIGIVQHAGHQAAGLPIAVEADGQPPHGVKNVAADFSHNIRDDHGGQRGVYYADQLQQNLGYNHGDHHPAEGGDKAQTARYLHPTEDAVIQHRSVEIGVDEVEHGGQHEHEHHQGNLPLMGGKVGENPQKHALFIHAFGADFSVAVGIHGAAFGAIGLLPVVPEVVVGQHLALLAFVHRGAETPRISDQPTGIGGQLGFYSVYLRKQEAANHQLLNFHPFHPVERVEGHGVSLLLRQEKLAIAGKHLLPLRPFGARYGEAVDAQAEAACPPGARGVQIADQRKQNLLLRHAGFAERFQQL